MSVVVVRVGVSAYENLAPQCIVEDTLDVVCYPGAEVDIIRRIALEQHLSLKFVYSKVPGCGRRGDNTSWSGSVLDMLYRRQIDITGNMCTLTEERTELFEPSLPIVWEPVSFLLKMPNSVLYYRFRPSAPFQVPLWCFMFMLLVAIYLSVMFRTALERRYPLAEASRRFIDGALSYVLQWRLCPRLINWLCVVGFFAFLRTLYSCHIREALLSPTVLPEPFDSEESLLSQLGSGNYRLIDYVPKAVFQIYGLKPENQKKLRDVIDHQGYKRVEPGQLLMTLSNTHHAILAKNEYEIFNRLLSYNGTEKLWKLSMQFGANRLCYYWNRGFRFGQRINREIIAMMEFIQRQTAVNYVKVKAKIHDTHYPMRHYKHRLLKTYRILLFAYLACLILALLVLLVEIFAYHFGTKASSPEAKVPWQLSVTYDTTDCPLGRMK